MTVKQVTLSDFIKNNAWGLVTLVFVGAVNYGMFTTRLEALEKRMQEHSEQLASLSSVRTMAFQIDMMQGDVKDLKSKVGSYDAQLQHFYKNDWIKVERLLAKLETQEAIMNRVNKNKNIGAVINGDQTNR